MKTVSLSFKELYKENGAETKYGHYIDFYSCDDWEFVAEQINSTLKNKRGSIKWKEY